MKHASSLELPNDPYNQSQAPQTLQQPLRNDNNAVRNLGVNFEDLMPAHSGPTSPNFQKMNEILKSPILQGSRPTSMVIPEHSHNSWIIPLQDQCLETSMPIEDLIGQLESPKLSNKMQMIFNSNVLSESIMKNTFRAVDESRVKLEDKDLQVELEISELKLHHLEKRVEGCLASSKNTLALNAQLSQNVSKMVSPVKSSQGVLTSNIRTRNNSRSNTPRDNIEDSPSPISSKNEALSKHRPKSLMQRSEDNYQETGQRDDQEFGNQNMVRMKDILEINRDNISAQEKRAKSVSMSTQEPNSRLKDSIINEAYQKLNCYYGPGDQKVKEPQSTEENYQETLENGGAKPTLSHSHTKSTELIMSNNVTFYTNLNEKEPEEQTRNLTRLQSTEYLCEDQEPVQKQSYVFSSKPREVSNASPPGAKTNTMPREVTLVDADGKERVFTLKPKETLRVEKLETIFVIPIGNKTSNISKSKVRSQYSSFQGSETEEGSQIKDNLKHIQSEQILNVNQTLPATNSRISLFDHSNTASMNLDKQEHKLSAFSGQNTQEVSPIHQFAEQKDAYMNNLKLQILNHPKCKKFFGGEDTFSISARGRSVENNNSRESNGMEFYFKQKIQDFREFLNEFENILPTENSLSPVKEPLRKPKNVQKIKNWEQQGLKEQTIENIHLESRTQENTPRGFFNENQENMRGKCNSSVKQSANATGYFAEQSPISDLSENKKLVRFESHELSPQQLFKENQGDLLSAAKTNFISTKSSFYSNAPVKKSKTAKIGGQKEQQVPSKAIKLIKGQSVALPSNQTVEKKRVHDKSASVKSFTLQGKNKKVQVFDEYGTVEAVKKRDKNLNRASSKSIVEVVNLGKIPQRANSVVVQK